MASVVARCRELADNHPDALYAAGVAAIVALGIWLRCLGYFDDSLGFWNDESAWMRRFEAGRTGIRPPGYAALSQLVIARWPSETWLRAPSLMAGCLTLPAAWVLLRSADCSRSVSLLGLLLLAVHPWAVAFSKEFKPYAIELLLHALLLYGAFRYYRRPTWGHFIGMAVLAISSLAFAWNVPFLGPGLLAVAVVAQVSKRRYGQLVALLAATTLAAAVALYIYFTQLADREVGTEYWGKKYGVFYLGDSVWEHMKWLLVETYDVARLPARSHFVGLSAETTLDYVAPAFAVLVVSGILHATWHRRWDMLLLGVSPWAAAAFANWLGYWPYGVFRTNLFLLVYPLLVGVHGLHAVASMVRRQPVAVRRVAAAGVVAWAGALLAVDPAYFATKDPATGAHASSTHLAMDYVVEHAPIAPRKSRPRLLLDGHACDIFGYYTKKHPTRSEHYRDKKLGSRVRRTCYGYKKRDAKRAIRRYAKNELYLIVSKADFAQWTVEYARQHCRVRSEKTFATGDVVLHCKPKKPAGRRKKRRRPKKG